MRKDIVNTVEVAPIVHKPRNILHKTFGESRDHGDFTFNNQDYQKGSWIVKIFGHRKFVLMFWRLFFPMLFYGAISALVSILLPVLIKDVYVGKGLTHSIFIALLYTTGKFGYINIFVAQAWVLMSYPVVGNYIGKKMDAPMKEALRFVFYIVLITSSIALIFEYIYAQDLVYALVFKTYKPDQTDLQTLQSAVQPLSDKTYWTDVEHAYQIKYSVITVHFFVFTSYFVGWTSLYVPMFSSKRQNRILIIATLIGVLFFIITYVSYLYAPAQMSVYYDPKKASFATFNTFNNLIDVSCGLYLGYMIVIPFCLFMYTAFPRFFSAQWYAMTFWLKNLYNSMVDKKSKYEFKLDEYKYKKDFFAKKIEFYEQQIQANQDDLAKYKKTNDIENYQITLNKLQKNKAYYETHLNLWKQKVNFFDKKITKFQELAEKTPSSKATLFYIDWNLLENLDNSDRKFMFLNKTTGSHWEFKVSAKEMGIVLRVSLGTLFDQLGYGAVSLALSVYATSFAGNVLGIPGTQGHAIAGAYYKEILASAALISGYLAWVYNGFVLLPQYFVAYYLGRGDKETAYHNEMIMMNWSFIVGLVLCAIVLIYGGTVNHQLNSDTNQTAAYFKLVSEGKITWTQFYQDCFYMDLILGIVEIFDASTALSYYMLVSGGCKWTFFIEQTVRITGTVVLIILYTGASDPKMAGAQYFNFDLSSNMFVYYIIGRSHSVIPSLISWIFIERGTALRSVDPNKKVALVIGEGKDFSVAQEIK